MSTPAEDVDYFLVDVPTQQVRVYDGAGSVLWQTAVSTSVYGLGEVEGSLKTPRGWLHVEEKFGGDELSGAIFHARVATGEIWTPALPRLEEDLILTRILWLAGDEPHNANTLQRYIYFHGTNHEDAIGKPASHGCIRLRNIDMLTLFDYAAPGTRVLIQAA